MDSENTVSAHSEIGSHIPDVSNANKKPESRKSGRPSFRVAFFSLGDSLCHALTISMVVYFFWDCLNQSISSLTGWHASLFTLAYVFFMTEGLLIFLPHSVISRGWGHKYLIKLHWILELLGFICLASGMTIIIVSKNQSNRRHFVSSHAITGLVAVILAVLVSLFGWWTRLDRKYHLGLKMSHLKLIHTALGVVSYGVGMAAQILGYFTHYYMKKHDVEWRVFLSVMTALLSLVAFLFASTSLYKRTREILRK
ncbi:transmembrane reductase CYB561D2-like [Cloeon dipterum]|uniref:transmembrane reductase CYB561D2-like n=1 Tax=Cloeon dipterum TaxID=197152 RepID=UPI00321FB663